MGKGDGPKEIREWKVGPKRTTDGINEIIKTVNDHEKRIAEQEKGKAKFQALVIKDGVLRFAMIDGIPGDEF